MPTAIPAAAAAQLPPARMIDPRGHRFGAGVSAVALLLGSAIQQPLVVALVPEHQVDLTIALGQRPQCGRVQVDGDAAARFARPAHVLELQPARVQLDHARRGAEVARAAGHAIPAFTLPALRQQQRCARRDVGTEFGDARNAEQPDRQPDPVGRQRQHGLAIGPANHVTGQLLHHRVHRSGRSY